MARQVFINANLLDGDHAAQPGMTVAVTDKRIEAVGRHIEIAADDIVYDLAGRTLMPGMVSGHFHSTFHNLGNEPGVATIEHPPGLTAYRALANAQLALSWGFTSLASAGCAYDIDAQLEQAIALGLVEGPRLIPCSPDTLSSTDGALPWWIDLSRVRSGVQNVDGPDEMRKAVRLCVQRGARLFKVTASGGHGVFVKDGARIFTFPELQAAVEAAHDLGIRVRAHIAGKPFILDCIRAGIDILDHCDDMDEECIEAMVKAGVYVLPSLYQPHTLVTKAPLFGFAADETKRAFDAMCAILPKAVAAGVKLVTGDDFGTGLAPHGDYARELAIYVDHAGIEPLEVLRWATRNGAGLVEHPDDLGLIEAGRIADMIVVDGDPSRDITVLQDRANIHAVLRDGRFVTDKRLAEADHAALRIAA